MLRLLRPFDRALKRLIDIAASGLGLLVLSPVLIGLAIAINRGSPGPVFYRGVRAGRGGKTFRIYKFRTMVLNADQIGGSSTSGDDPRVTPVGAFLRRRKLDELPQLINVLVGDMSLVGPRPEVPYYTDQFTGEERDILSVRPGITDWASLWNSDEGAILAGAEDPDKAYEEIIRPTKLLLQIKYVRERSVLTDFKILSYTLQTVLGRDPAIPELDAYPHPQPATATS
jgi:lipopolysaccharide/colanic/teichoic acid biosynthesis glycosyltransferase